MSANLQSSGVLEANYAHRDFCIQRSLFCNNGYYDRFYLYGYHYYYYCFIITTKDVTNILVTTKRSISY